MRRILAIVFLVVCIAGCEQKTPPDKIEVDTHNTVEWTGITITYSRGNNNTHKVTLDTPEKLAEYKAELQMVLKQLEDAERKMNVHGDTTEPVQPD